jgi:hypothetical protein
MPAGLGCSPDTVAVTMTQWTDARVLVGTLLRMIRADGSSTARCSDHFCVELWFVLKAVQAYV